MKLSSVLFALLATTGAALAQDPPADGTTDGTGDGTATDPAAPPADGDGSQTPADPAGGVPGVVPPLTLGKGKIAISGSTVNINLSKDAVGKPISFAPSVWYGVSDVLTVGVTHDGGTTAWTPRPAPGSGICISSEEDGCAKVYDNVSLDVIYGIKNEKFSVAAHGALDVESFDPATLSLRVGVLGRYMASDKLAIAFDPRISIGLTERDGADDGMGGTIGGNKELIDIPLYVWFRANEKLGVYGSAGIAGPLDGFGDAYIIPVGAGASFAVNEKLTVGADFFFIDIAGKTELGADGRVLALRASYSL